MTKDELIDCLGTIAQSGTSKFLKALKVTQNIPDDMTAHHFFSMIELIVKLCIL